MTAPKILGIDIETSPALVYTWGLWDQNVGLNQVVEPTRMLCFAAKWFGKSGVIFASEHESGRDRMVEVAHELLEEADAVVHYNGRSFDEKHLNREFLLAGLAPPAPYHTVDLLSVVKGNFRFLSNKLQHVSTQIGLEGKVGHEGFDLWRRCLDGDEVAWRKMRRYNKRDVTLLEDAYKILRPWIKSHPNLNQWNGLEGCPRCGAGPDRLQKRGFRRTSVSTFQRYQCQECGGWCSDGKRVAGVDKRAV